MRTLLIAIALAWTSVASAAPGVTAEVGAGGAFLDRWAPELSARTALGLGHWVDVGMRGQLWLGPSTPSYELDPSGYERSPFAYRAWSVFPELRLHTPQRNAQLDLSFGLGLGEALHFATGSDDEDLEVGSGHVAPFWQVALGARAGLGQTWFARVEAAVFVQYGIHIDETGYLARSLQDTTLSALGAAVRLSVGHDFL